MQCQNEACSNSIKPVLNTSQAVPTVCTALSGGKIGSWPEKSATSVGLQCHPAEQLSRVQFTHRLLNRFLFLFRWLLMFADGVLVLDHCPTDTSAVFICFDEFFFFYEISCTMTTGTPQRSDISHSCLTPFCHLSSAAALGDLATVSPVYDCAP